MNEAIINNWNNVVSPNDYVFHLGDFCFGGVPVWDKCLDSLNGRKFLVLGNHDFKNLKDGVMYKFDWVGQQAYIFVGERSIFLNHFFYLCFGGMHRDFNRAVFQFHGHVHLGPSSTSGKDINIMQNCMRWNQYDVGVDANNFTPISYNEIVEKIKFYFDNSTNQAVEIIK